MVLQGGTAVVNVVANGAALASSISGAVTNATQRVGRSMQSTGLAMTKFLTVPLAAVGAVSTKLALDFNTTFSRIEALAGDIGGTTKEAKEFVLDLAHATGQDPGGLAEAMYFAASAGLRAKEVFPVVEAAAQAAATGMADASTNAKLLTTVLHDYAGTGLDATNAMNILTRAIKVGKAEPADFAENIGIVIPLASQLGVTFQDVAAAIAQASNAGVEVSRATTGLRFLLAALQNPTEESKSAFEDFGISIQDVQNRIAEPGGLLAVMQDIATTFDLTTVAGKEAWGTITGGARGAVIANTLVGNSAKSARKVWEELGLSAKDTATDFQDAFEIMKRTPQFRFQQALTDLKEVAIELGNILIPILTKEVIPAIKDVIKWFQNLSDGTKETIVKVGILAAAFGPLLAIFGSVVRLAGSVVGALVKIGGAAVTAGTATEGVGVAAGLTISPLGLAAAAVSGFAGAALLAADNSRDFNNEVNTMVESFHKAPDALQAATDSIDEFNEGLLRAGGIAPIAGQFATFRGGSRDVKVAKEAIDQYAESVVSWNNAMTSAREGAKSWASQLADNDKLTGKQSTTLKGLASDMDVLKIRLTDSQKNLVNNLIAQGRFSDAVKELKNRIAEVTERRWDIKITSHADTSGINTMVANMVGAGFHREGTDWVAHGMVVVHSKAGSPWPWEKVEKGMTDVGFTRRTGGGGGGEAWSMKTIVEITADFTKVQQRLQTLIPLIRAAAGEGAADQAHSFARDLKGLEKQFDRLKTKALDFRDAIKGAFTDAADLIGTIGEALSQFASDQAQFLEDQKAFQEGGGVGEAPTAPTAVDISALIRGQVAQAQQLASLLKKLQGQGLNVANLTQIAGQGAGGIPIAEALLQDPALIQQLNNAQEQIANITQRTADQMTQADFGGKLVAMSNALDTLLGRLNHFLDGLRPEKINDKNQEFVDALDHLINAINNATGQIGGGDGNARGGGLTVNVFGGGGNEATARAVRDELLRIGRNNLGTGL